MRANTRMGLLSLLEICNNYENEEICNSMNVYQRKILMNLLMFTLLMKIKCIVFTKGDL